MISYETAYAALETRDPRFDGLFYIAVTTTGIYCRPSCPAVMPKRENIRLFTTSAAAQVNGFRACKRCRPDAVPGSPEWNIRADLVGRAMRLIADGTVDREGVAGLAARLGYSERQVHRQLVADVGAGPQALARAQRAQTARVLLETTDLKAGEIAFAAGFASIRQFNETIQHVFATAPTRLRAARSSGPVAPGTITLRLAYRPPLHLRGLLDFLGTQAIPGIEEYDGQTYRRSLVLPHGSGTVALRDAPGTTYVHCELHLQDLRDLTAAVQRCRRMLDLDADMQAITDTLTGDPLLRPLLAACPGRRIPGHVDPVELAVRAVLDRGTVEGLVEKYGRPLPAPAGRITHMFPHIETLADLPQHTGKGRTLRALAGAIADESLRLDTGADREEVQRRLLALPGIGPETADYIRMRALGDPDVLLVPAVDSDRWRPWRSYATQYLTRGPFHPG
jgi:AraC family transcriptional regulator of adaptative response / DNA-3-methyladenine glycosylase II